MSLSNAFTGFGFARGLGGLERASERRFQQSLLRLQQQQLDNQIAEATDLLDVELEAQRKLVELQQESLNALAESIDLAAEAQEFLTEAVEEDQERAKEAATQMQTSFGTLSTALTAFMALWEAKSQGSAGGLIGREGETYDRWKGWPWATGDVKLSFNEAPPGWFQCDGTVRRRDEFPGLNFLIGGLFNPGADHPDWFRLPSKSEICNNGVLMALQELQFFVRY